MRLSNIFIYLFVSLPLLFCDGVPKNLRRYKVCNGARCKSVRSIVDPELFDMDSFLYTGWSRWSPCTRKCVTNRYRACRFPSICGERMVIHEEAFCYRRGTHCEFIFQNSRRDFLPDDSDDYDHYSEDVTGSQSSERSAESAGSTSNSNSVNLNTGNNGRNQQPRNDRVGRRYATIGANPTTKVPLYHKNQSTIFSPNYLNNNNHNNNRTTGSRHYGRRRGHEPNNNNEESQCGIARLSEVSTRGLALRILGGQESRKGRWPWQVAILNRMQEAFCGGTLIAPRWILTAAHCVRRRMQVTIGEHHLHRNEGTERHYKIDAAFIHPDFDPETVNNDIALLLLPEPVSTTGLACLPQPHEQLPSADTLCTILGWGKERHTHIFGTTVLHEGKVPIVSTAECRFTYPYEITHNMFCAGYKGGSVDSCAGDSGGPILCTDNYNRWTVFGVTSFGDGCGRQRKYGIYAKVPNYVSWIQKVMQANEYLN